jgi:MFS family permease
MDKPPSSESSAASATQVAPQVNSTAPKSVADEEIHSPSIARVASEQPYSVFSYGAKLFIVLMAAGAGLMSAFAATLYYPALNALALQLNVSDALITVSVTTYMLAQAIAPAFIGGLSDQGGRRLAFLICVTIYTVANIGLALQTNFAALLVLRCLQAAGSSPTIALAVAIVADISTSAERGKFMGYATGGILVGPAVGPVFGGLLARYLGWRSIFWALLIFGVSYGLVFAVFVPETSRNVVGNGSIPARGVNISVLGHLQRRKLASDAETQLQLVKPERQKFVWPNPLRTLVILKEKESAILLIYNGLFFNGYMVTSIVLPYLLSTYYGYDELKVGLCYLPLGAGSLIAAVVAGRMVDRRFQRVCIP